MRTALATASLGGLCLLVFLAAGCEDERIRRYQVPQKAKVSTADAGQSQRMLAAMVPREKRNWFFKIMGPPEAVAAEKENFRKFLQSVTFDAEGAPIGFEPPSGWQRTQSDSSMRFATFKVGPDGKLDLTIVPLPASAGDVLANVNRWRGQLGLDAIAKDQLGEHTEKVKLADGATAIAVDFEGVSTSSMSGAPFAGGGGAPNAPFAGGAEDPVSPTPSEEPEKPAADTGSSPAPSPRGGESPSSGDGQSAGGSQQQAGSGALSYDMPDAWSRGPDRRMRVASFAVKDGQQQAEISVIPLRGKAGGVILNIQRWRRQVGLSKASENEIRSRIETIEVAGGQGQYVDLKGPASAEPRRRILAVIRKRGDRSWFFKMMGHAELVGGQKENFERFVRSVEFTSGGGNADG